MRVDELRTLFEYNAAANERVLASAARIAPGDLVAPAAVSHGSLLGTLAHVYAAEWVWRMRVEEGRSPAALPTVADVPALEAVHERLASEDRAWAELLARCSDEDLDRPVRYANTRGTAFETPLWQIALHVVNHGTQFRAEAAVLLTQRGVSPGDLDLIAYLRSLPAPS